MYFFFQSECSAKPESLTFSAKVVVGIALGSFSKGSSERSRTVLRAFSFLYIGKLLLRVFFRKGVIHRCKHPNQAIERHLFAQHEQLQCVLSLHEPGVARLKDCQIEALICQKGFHLGLVIKDNMKSSFLSLSYEDEMWSCNEHQCYSISSMQ
ncbi:MAG: hypothetical protein EZS28_031836 [Streblomastix strix]|uniref:Uncharacterized protein n=1 Tax=Streblomastix strix TaxID=222440 RepID=A0A5J4UQ78_9EUKA|nr:MAG: hypothetical protein EZS28_031836 [Streblomastix strix]